MDSGMHIAIVITLSMIMTFMLYCTLKDRKASGSLFQNILVERTRDQLLYTRCWWHSEKINTTCEYFFISEDIYNIPVIIPIIVIHMSHLVCFRLQKKSIYVRPVIATIICGWFIARVMNGVDLWYEVDMISVYFLIWQVIFVITKWELKQLPVFSPTIIRGWLCTLMAFGAFTVYDTVFRYLSTQVSFIFFWILSFSDIFVCLHPDGRFYNKNVPEELLQTDLQIPIGVYSTWDLDDNESDEESDERCIGEGDLYIYNLMLLLILPPLSSMTTNILVTITYIITVQIGCETTFRLGFLYDKGNLPAVPLPVAFVSMYAIILDIFIEY